SEPGGAASRRPELTPEQEQQIFHAAGRRVAAAVRRVSTERLEEVLGEVSQAPVFGSFVSLKRSGQLRSCCGYLGSSVPLAEALEHAAVRAAREDPRFPPISPAELDDLDMEVWLLWGCKPVTYRGEERAKAVVIGKHGLQIARGHNRGLLLPSVAVEHGLDAVGFLRQVCLKAGLPAQAWKDDDTTLMTFEGYAIRGRLKAALGEPAQASAESPGGPTRHELLELADFCRGNLERLVLGATPDFYLPGGFDGSVCGAVLSVRLPGSDEPIEFGKVSTGANLPLQATLFGLTQAAARAIPLARQGAGSLTRVACGVSVLWDPVLHGTLGQASLEAIDPKRRAVVLVASEIWAVAFDPGRTAAELVDLAAGRARLRGSARVQVASAAMASTEPRIL
ncbi:MAG: AmmeMemoRadiSam system protein A, partial [Thermoguttaceae bacterium]|nr:AmmeMemoRadiSam system protein A [Thermoguttaceae bacterium]